jgi:hypothetical protein
MQESPWKRYKKIYGLQFGESEFVTVAEERYSPCNIVNLRSFSGPSADDQLRMLQQIQHAKFVSALEIYNFDKTFCVAFEHMLLSLQEIAGNPYLDEIRLASILGQVNFRRAIHVDQG